MEKEKVPREGTPLKPGPQSRSRLCRPRRLTINEAVALTISEVVRMLHDAVVQADARGDVLPCAAVTVQVEVVILLGHVNAVAVHDGRVRRGYRKVGMYMPSL